jgi:hypothetical protein
VERRTEVPGAVDHRRRREYRLVHVVHVQQLERLARFHHERLAPFVGEEKLAVDGDG